jgi:hypothetical protein
VQLATVFWGALWLYFRNYLTGLFMVLIIPTVIFSRLYLGVHSGYDVLGGVFFGFALLSFYHHLAQTTFISAYFLKNQKNYWLTFLMILIFYSLMNQQGPIPPMIPLALGALIGYGLSLPYLDLSQSPFFFRGKEITYYLISLSLLVIVSKFLQPLSSHSLYIGYLLMMVRIIFLVWAILIAIPWIVGKISLRTWKKSSKI